jgi:GNAT superfamily N-acetyltransferase
VTLREGAKHLALGDFACWVVEIDDEIVAFGVGMVHQRLPAEHNPSGRWGYIQSMETHPAYRRRGYASVILRVLQAWCRGLGLPSASLVASRAGEPLCRQHGFAEERFGTPLIWFIDDGIEAT